MTDIVFSWSGAASLLVPEYWLTVRIVGKKINGRTIKKARYQMKIRAMKGDETAKCSIWLATNTGTITADPASPVSSEADPLAPSSWIVNTYEGDFYESGDPLTNAFSGQSELEISNPLVNGFAHGMVVLLEIKVYVTVSDAWGAAICDSGGWTPCTVFLYDGAVWHKQALSSFNGIEW